MRFFANKPTGRPRSNPCQRFMRSVDKRSPAECWPWLGTKVDGYGVMQLDGKQRKAYRLSYMIHRGQIPCGLLIRHLCNNPACVNPRHLAIGNEADNAADRAAAGRTQRGASHKLAKLTETMVREIRASTLSQDATAKLYGISQTNVGYIRRRETWAHVGAG